MTTIEIFNNIANSIRNKLGSSNKISPNNYSNEISKIVTSTTINKTSGTGSVTTKCSGLARKTDSSQLKNPKQSMGSGTLGDYAIFAGGYQQYGVAEYYADIETYTASLVKGSATDLSEPREYLAATTIGSYALFGGGLNGSTNKDTVDSYNTSLTHSTPTSLSTARYDMGAAHIGNYALFGGGSTLNNTSTYATVDTYNSSLAKGTATVLSEAKRWLSATSVGNYALFAGGYNYTYPGSYTYYATVDTYSSSLTKTTAEDLSIARSNLAATAVGNYALFGGGSNSDGYSAIVDKYDRTLTKGVATSLSENRCRLAATTITNYALFGGGYHSTTNSIYDSINSSAVDGYSGNLTKIDVIDLSISRYYIGSAAIGGYGIFAGGVTGSISRATLDVYYQLS